jgi:hypothetical protein
MLKSLAVALALASVAFAGSAGLAPAQYQPGKQCAMPITKGGCPIWIPAPQPGPTLPKPPRK